MRRCEPQVESNTLALLHTKLNEDLQVCVWGGGAGRLAWGQRVGMEDRPGVLPLLVACACLLVARIPFSRCVPSKVDGQSTPAASPRRRHRLARDAPRVLCPVLQAAKKQYESRLKSYTEQLDRVRHFMCSRKPLTNCS